jgi:recombination protein RecA
MARELRTIPISDRERQVIIGSLLGDGSITLTKQGRGMLNVCQTIKHSEYFYWKRRQMPRLFFPDHNVQHIRRVKRGRMNESLYCYSIVRDVLTDLRRKFYPKGKKIVPASIIEDLSPLAIAVWHMDDGYMSKRGNSIHFILATNCFDRKSINRLIKALGVHGVTAIAKGTSIPNQWILRIGRRDNAARFTKLIRRYVPPVMHYKLP